MSYLIDSDWFIAYGDGRPDALALLQSLAVDGLALSVISYMEAYQGYWRAGEAARATFEAAVSAFRILPVSTETARHCAILRETLRQQGRRVNSRSMDLLIAATAIEHGLVLVTRNVADSADLPGLTLYHR